MYWYLLQYGKPLVDLFSQNCGRFFISDRWWESQNKGLYRSHRKASATAAPIRANLFHLMNYYASIFLKQIRVQVDKYLLLMRFLPLLLAAKELWSIEKRHQQADTSKHASRHKFVRFDIAHAHHAGKEQRHTLKAVEFNIRQESFNAQNVPSDRAG